MTTDQISIRKIERIHDMATNKYLEVIEFPTSPTTNSKVNLLPAVVNDRSLLEKELRNAGATLPKEDGKLSQLLEAVAKSDAPEDLVYAEHTGWTEDGKAFVLVDGLIGTSKTRVIGVSRTTSATDLSGRRSTKGTWQEWRNTVALPASHSTILMVAISAALAAPLLAIVNRGSFTINLVGQTRSGKTVATVVAASVIGTAREADLITWNITDARLETRLAEFNDSIFPIDDLQAMRAKDKDRYQRVRDLAYKIAQGWTTARHESFTSAHEGVHRSWTCIVLTSSEKSVRDLAHAVKMERQHGEALRLIDVPAVFDGLDHIFDQLPDGLDKTDVEGWKKEMFKTLADACEQNHGQAWRMYIEALIAKPSTLKLYVEKRVSFFEKHVCDDFDANVARDVARKFGLLYAGGMLGIRCGLLPWDKKQLLKAVAKSYRHARDLLPDDGILLRSGMAALRSKIRKLPLVSNPPSKRDAKLAYDTLDGFRQHIPDVANRYMIKRDAFRQIFSTSEQATLVLGRLIEKQRITLAVPKQSSGPAERIPQSQFVWPDGERRRSIEIVWGLNKKAKDEDKKQKKKKAVPTKKGK